MEYIAENFYQIQLIQKLLKIQLLFLQQENVALLLFM